MVTDLFWSSGVSPKRQHALTFRGHFVEDIHQLLHVSYEDDRGGNKIVEEARGPRILPARDHRADRWGLQICEDHDLEDSDGPFQNPESQTQNARSADLSGGRLCARL